MEAPFHYYEFDPDPALARHVTSYWAFRARSTSALSHRIWPDGCTSLAWILPRGGRPLAVLTGPHLRAHDVMVEPGTEYWGARFWPDAGGAVTGIAAPELRDLSVPAPAPFRTGLDGLGERQLQRRFREAVGLTPKQFARIRRMRETAAGMLRPDARGWAGVAADFGYADQSHLIHEFSQLTGLTPVAFEDRLRRIEHGNVRP